MPGKSGDAFDALVPDLQVAFYHRLRTMRKLYLSDALRATVDGLDIPRLDHELAEYVSPDSLRRVASFGVRGEVVFAVPCVLQSCPFLLGYYRLLYGLSEKAFYSKGPFGRFRRMEERGDVPDRIRTQIPGLCHSLARTAEQLVRGVDRLTASEVHELQLLTLGAALRGSELNRIGQEAAQQVFHLIRNIVEPHLKDEPPRTLVIRNASAREVRITFADDPDVRVTEMLPTGEQPRVSIEIKGGTDASNVYNRIGEAEKSHLKARQAGFSEFWTLVRADYSAERAARDSPTTRRFFHLSRILNPADAEHRLFRDSLCTQIGIPAPEH